MKKYTVIWEVSHKVEVEAENEEQAIDMIYNNDYDEQADDTEIVLSPEIL